MNRPASFPIPIAALSGAVVLALVLAGTPGAEAGIEVAPAPPVQGERLMVTVTGDAGPLAGATVKAVYRPGSEVSHTEDLGATGPDGTVSWTPADAGVVTLSAALPAMDGAEAVSLSRNVAVRFRGVPPLGLIIMLGAGIILYGGVVRGFMLLGPAPEPPHLPPDT